MIEQERDGMQVDQFAEYFEYSNGYEGEQPYVENKCDDVFGYCLGVYDESCIK